MAYFRQSRVLSDRPPVLSNPILRYVTYAIVVLVLSLVQVVLVPLIAIEGITPDLLLIFGVWVALQEGQLVGMVTGFTSGLVFDLVSADVLGSNALAKVVAIFLAGYFYKNGMEQERSGSWLFPLIVLVCGAVHNLLYYFFYLRSTEIDVLNFLLLYGVFTTLYTAVLSVIPKLIISRKTDL
jgi:rod shape-determining protein MreD